MSIFQSIILGIVQGLTEFLPISSSGHLVLVPYFLGWVFPHDQIFPFDVLVQLGTLLAVIIYFHSDLWTIIKAFILGIIHRMPFADFNARLGWFLILATIPAAIVGLAIKNIVEAVFQSPTWVAVFLLVTAAFLFIAEKVGKKKRKLKKITWKDALWIGGWQVISLFPGVSRSGSTIAGGMTRNLDRPSSARFSFLMSVPVMLAAGLISALDLRKVPNLSKFLPPLVIGFVLAAIVGFFSIRWLFKLITKHSFYGFAIYCAVLGLFTLGFSFFCPILPAPVTNLATPQVLTVEVSPSVSWLGNTFSQCARLQSNLAVIIDQKPVNRMDPLTQPDFRWGDPTDFSGFKYPLGSNTLVVIVNPSNPYATIDLANLLSLFSGVTTHWPDSSSTKVNVWNYLEGEDIQQHFESALLKGGNITSLSSLASDPSVMVKAVASDPGAIGFIPSHFLDSSVKSITITGLDPASLNFPVLALAPSEPAGLFRIWLACLQTSLNH